MILCGDLQAILMIQYLMLAKAGCFRRQLTHQGRLFLQLLACQGEPLQVGLFCHLSLQVELLFRLELIVGPLPLPVLWPVDL
jgi:hypothetical protein